MTAFIDRIVDFFKLIVQPKVVSIVALASGALTFLPPAALESMRLAAVVEEISPWPSLFFLGCVSGLIVHFVCWAVPLAKRWNQKRNLRVDRIERLGNLTTDEKALLAGFVRNNTREQTLPHSHGVVSELTRVGVIRVATLPNSDGALLAAITASFVINEWAWQHLNEHSEILEGVEQLRSRRVHGDEGLVRG